MPFTRPLIFCLAVLGNFLLLPLCASAIPPISPGILAYYENDNGPSSASLHARADSFNQLAFDTYSVDASGHVSGKPVRADLAFARAHGIQTFATVSNFADGDFRADIAHAVVRSADATHTFVADLTAKLTAGHYQGANLDFEAVPAADRQAFTTFVKTVSASLHAAGYLVMISVPAKTQDDPTDGWTGAFNDRALGRKVDVFQLMTYDENGSWGDPGPVAGLDWVEACVAYTASVVPAAKVSLGVPAYGYDWDLTDPGRNAQLPWTGVSALLASTGADVTWDEASSSPHFAYTAADGHRHVVWAENTRSITLKAGLVSKYGLAGVSVYALGMEDDAFWQAVYAAGF